MSISTMTLKVESRWERLTQSFSAMCQAGKLQVRGVQLPHLYSLRRKAHLVVGGILKA